MERVSVRRGAYHDSIALMMFSRDARAVDGVTDAAAMMATPLNLELLARQGYRAPSDPVEARDVVLAVRARDDATIGRVEQLFDDWALRRSDRNGASAGRGTSRSARTLLRETADLNLLIVSVPGAHAAYEVAAGLEAGVNVFCFSSGMSLEDERTLKELAALTGVMLLGPDCGTAILDGIGIGFANAVERGPVGIVGASGTGIQEACCLLDAAGVGISHAIGVGSRDLSDEVGGLMTFRALDLLSRDSMTETIVLLSKPIGRRVATTLMERARDASKPVVLGVLGGMPDGAALLDGVPVVDTLFAVAGAAARFHDRSVPVERVAAPGPTPGYVRGSFCGGTLCHEAGAVAVTALGDLSSNIAIAGATPLENVWESRGHTFLDLGDEALTEGRLHPMIDPTLRNERAMRDGLDPAVGVVLMDVVLGYGAHPDPAEDLVPLVQELLDVREDTLSIVISICGTEEDPQDLADQRRRLEAAGATVTRSAARAAQVAVEAAGLGGPAS